MLHSKMSALVTPIPLSEIESVLSWVDTFKLSRSTKKIHRDFSDAVLLAEILSKYYPKLVEMHNYPPRNSHALKLNNWLTLNRKVLKKLKLYLCTDTMEQLANCTPGVIERILIMVREKINRDEEANKSKDAEQNMSSGGSYYEACEGDDQVLVVPVKTRVNGVLEMVQEKVVVYSAFLNLKEELKDAKEATEVLKQKVEHLENMMKLKEERIDELHKQLERKASRRKEVENMQNNINVPLRDSVPVTPKVSNDSVIIVDPKKVPILKNTLSYTKMKDLPNSTESDVKLPPQVITEIISEHDVISKSDNNVKIHAEILDKKKSEIITAKTDLEVVDATEENINQEIDAEQKNSDEEFKDSIQDIGITIEETIQREINDITNTAQDEQTL